MKVIIFRLMICHSTCLSPKGSNQPFEKRCNLTQANTSNKGTKENEDRINIQMLCREIGVFEKALIISADHNRMGTTPLRISFCNRYDIIVSCTKHFKGRCGYEQEQSYV